MNVFLWILQIVLAAMFAMAGVQKSTLVVAWGRFGPYSF
jgi:uncharacterized membrane protein YphA (DoxX/SURF4 family)